MTNLILRLSLTLLLSVGVTTGASSVRGLGELSSENGENFERYKILTSEVIKYYLDQYKIKYPNFFHLTSSQEKYGLPTAGSPEDCPFDKDVNGCRNFIFTIQDFQTYPEGSESSNHLPEVFWSGCLHGNERVGPTSVVHAAGLLLESAACEALPGRNADKDSWEKQLEKAKTCRADLKQKGISDAQRKWLARLVSTRRIVVVPTANALGYYQNKREEGGVDPNRDFPYDLKDSSLCMRTIAGRTLNEVYQEHMFQLALTFHAGMEVVGYEWGAPTWLGHLSPDDTAQKNVAAAYSRYGGGWQHSKAYNYGTMNDMVYYVRGGMEDWAYAGSWDPDRVQPCEPTTFGGYEKTKTVYNNSTLRVFNMLVETSDNKEPHQDLGSSQGVLDLDPIGNGHISRNIRLALLAADMVEPYVSIFRVNDLVLSDDIVPSSDYDPRSCQKTLTNAVTVAKNLKDIEFEWTVGGALSIDNTELWYAKWSDIDPDDFDCFLQTTDRDLSHFKKGEIIGQSTGKGFFSEGGAQPLSQSGSEAPNGPVFKGKITIPDGVKAMDQFVVIASAKVDQDWTHMPKNYAPKTPPQSHIVNARTNPDWHHESAGKHIQGRLNWFSRPLTVVVGDFKDGIGNKGGHLVSTVEVNPRIGDSQPTKGGVLPKSPENGWKPEYTYYILASLLLCLILCCCKRFLCPRHEQFKLSDYESDGDDFIFEAKPYSDDVVDGEENDSVEELELQSLQVPAQ